MKVAVLGTGDAASALAARARSRGHRVVIWGRSGPRLDRLRRSAAIPVEPDLRAAVAAADTVVLAVASTAQATVLAQAAAALRDDHMVFLVPGHTGGFWTAAGPCPLPRRARSSPRRPCRSSAVRTPWASPRFCRTRP